MMAPGTCATDVDMAALMVRVIERCRDRLAEQEAYLCELDCAIGDGDHGTNMRRGWEALTAERTALARLPLPEACVAAGTILVMTIGGAAGPLYGTLLMEFGKGLAAAGTAPDYPAVFRQAVSAVARRGRCSPGEKTLLDVLDPLSDAVGRQTPLPSLAESIQGFAETTMDMKAMRGRASFLGERSRGHIDPGAASCAMLGAVVCHELAAMGAA